LNRARPYVPIVAFLVCLSGSTAEANAQNSSGAFAVTGSVPAGLNAAGSKVELRRVECLANCTIAEAEVSSTGTYFLWGSTAHLHKASEQLVVVAHLPEGLFLSKKFALSSAGTAQADVSLWNAAAARVFELFSRNPKSAKPGGLAPVEFAFTPPVQLYYLRTTLYFVTDRALEGGKFSNEPAVDATLHSGTLVAHVSRCRANDALSCNAQDFCDAPGDWSCEPGTQAWGDAHFDQQNVFGGSAPLDVLSAELERAIQTGPRTILVFVHGFNVDFETALNYGSRLSLEFEHRPHVSVVYSWPSLHDGQAYATDQERSVLAVPHFLLFLGMLARIQHETGASIILVGHSMGTHLITEALAEWRMANATGPPLFERVVYFAGDEGQADWSSDITAGYSRAALVMATTNNLTVYQSANDAALMASSCVMHDQLRLGQPSGAIPTQPNLDVRDVSNQAGYGSAGHTYFVQSTQVAQLFSSLVNNGTSPLSAADLTLPWLGPNDPGPPLPQIGAKRILCPAAAKIFGK
jgi:pimeloyl-ACP methyl ester carboxylesterase